LLPQVAPAERAPAARHFLARPAHRLPGEEQAAICAEVMAVLDHAEFAPLFSPESLAEVPLVGRLRLGPDGAELGIAGQVDRLVVTEREVLIVDYKTNRPAPQALDGVPLPYRRQLAAYRAALAALYPEKCVRTLLLWTDGPALMEVPAELPISAG
jgi:ATP-dependent helicase/nuclease subunit A